MIINTNMNALNAHRNMGINNTASGKSMEKLSSGLRINRAGDDAAGLAISEKMRGQIRGLDQASRNSQDGISMIQTAEGALNETTNILQRMRELGVQAGNDTNTDKDRTEIQKEINQLSSEINRIGNATEFNSQKLLDGSKDATTVATKTAGVTEVKVDTPAENAKITIGGLEISATTSGTGGNALSAEVVAGVGNNVATSIAADATGKLTITIGTDGSGTALAVTADDIAKLTIGGATGDAAKFTVTAKTPTTPIAVTTAANLSGGKALVTNGTVQTAAVKGVYEFEIGEEDITINGKSLTFKADGTGDFKDVDSLLLKINADTAAGGVGEKYTASKSVDGKVVLTQKATFESATAPVVTGMKDSSVSLQIGANENQSMTISISDMRAEKLGLTSKTATEGFTAKVGVTNGTDNTNAEFALDVSDSKNAGKAVTAIQKAIETVSGERSKLGAYQNRLDHTINNLGTSSENLTAAESRIRDVDMAKEMLNFSKNNILNQAAQSMLAQAKSQPEGVLQLLR